MKRRIFLTAALAALTILCSSAVASAQTYQAADLEELRTVFSNVEDGDVIEITGIIVNQWKDPVVTPAKSITICGGGGNMSLRDSLFLGGDLTLENIHIAFTDSSHMVGTDERSIFLQGHDLTIKANVDISADGWENSYRYCSIYSYKDGEGKTWDNRLTIESGTYDIIDGGAKNGSGAGHTDITLLDAVRINSQLNTGGEGSKAILRGNGFPATTIMSPASSIIGNGDLEIHDLNMSIGQIVSRSIALYNSSITTTQLTAGGDTTVPKGAGLSLANPSSIGGNFNGGGHLSLSGALSIQGTASGDTTVFVGSPQESTYITCADGGAGTFQFDNGRYHLVRTVTDQRESWTMERWPVNQTIDGMVCANSSYDEATGKNRYPTIVVVPPDGGQTPVQMEGTVSFVQWNEEYEYFDSNFSPDPRPDITLTVLDQETAGVQITQAPNEYGRFFYDVTPGLGSRTVTMEFKMRELVYQQEILVLDGWLPGDNALFFDKLSVSPEGIQLEMISDVGAECSVYAALYGPDGQMLDIRSKSFTGEYTEDGVGIPQEISFLDFSPESMAQAAFWKVFLLSNDNTLLPNGYFTGAMPPSSVPAP